MGFHKRSDVVQYIITSLIPRVDTVELKFAESGNLGINGQNMVRGGDKEKIPLLFYCIKYIFWSKSSVPEKKKALIDIFPVLVKHGLDVNKTWKGQHIIFFNKNTEYDFDTVYDVIKFLLPYGLDLNVKSEHSPYYFSLLSVLLLGSHPQGIDWGFIRNLLWKELDPTLVNSDGMTILHQWCATTTEWNNDHAWIFKLMFTRGLDINAKDKNGDTALQLYLKRSAFHNAEMLNFLIKNGPTNIRVKPDQLDNWEKEKKSMGCNLDLDQSGPIGNSSVSSSLSYLSPNSVARNAQKGHRVQTRSQTRSQQGTVSEAS